MAKRKKRTTRRRTGAKRSSRKQTASAGATGKPLETVSTARLAEELKRRERDLSRLESRREKVAAQLAELDDQIAALAGAGGYGATARGGVRRRPRNDKPLADALVAVLTGATMGVSEVAEAVQKAGYRTSSPNFRTIVNQTLLRDKRIKKIARGQYTAK